MWHELSESLVSDVGPYYHLQQYSLCSSIQEKYVASTLDSETRAFLCQCLNTAYLRRAFSHHAATVLRGFGFTRTFTNGFLSRGTMFVFSTEQLSSLLPPGFVATKECTILDIGAGDGGVSSVAAEVFQVPPKQVYVTEASWPMKKQLQRRGYTVLDSLSSALPGGDPPKFDVVLCLNVLDRVDDPSGLLQTIRQVSKPDSIIVLAVVFPFCPGVEKFGKDLSPPENHLPDMKGYSCCDRATFESSLQQFATMVLPNAGFDIIKLTKVPYVCDGDLFNHWYLLPDIVFTLKLK
eukprot:gnl/MRDRNA2_/MRDRNA2_70028_c0_seq1.p1 gnl/MRDRNA2_/MRDRNA2_70028_c0~~gnl/MRDRNA2_/MRDRNA2_70028_c0_seq1.p1  ORF type:complete len:293 (+),score=47.76 gnl/MRDRNA2_/MRDRNA2_70028_c0_seq1:109-987(+)